MPEQRKHIERMMEALGFTEATGGFVVMEQRLLRAYTRRVIAFGAPNSHGWFISLCAVTATTVLKSAFLLDAGLPFGCVSGFFFYFPFSIFRVWGQPLPLWGGVMLCTVSVFRDWPTAWLASGRVGERWGILCEHSCYNVAHLVGNVGPLPL